MSWKTIFACLTVYTVICAQAFQPTRVALSPSHSSVFSPLAAVPGNNVDRRDALKSGIATALSFLLLGKPVIADEPQTIVITGCNSGIGFVAARLLAERGHTLVLACRSLEKAKDTATRIKSETTSGTLIPAECDLANLDSVKAFAKDLKVDNIDVLCLNAGLSLNTDDKQIQRTADGFELTVGTNHLGHFLLNDLVLPKLNKSGGRIVITASSVHDPESPGGRVGQLATLGNLEGFERDGHLFEMVDGAPYNGDKAYKDSKLCNVLFTRELQRRLSKDSATKGIFANSFSPGLITSTGFFRNQNPVFSKVFGVVATNIAGVAETPEWGGASLAYMVTSEDTKTRGEFYTAPPGSSKYGNDAFGREFTVATISKEAQDDAKAIKLWDLSEKLVGIKA